jgi:hypothetical protein
MLQTTAAHEARKSFRGRGGLYGEKVLAALGNHVLTWRVGRDWGRLWCPIDSRL